MSLRKFTCRNGSRFEGSERWTSTNGRWTPSRASRRAPRPVPPRPGRPRQVQVGALRDGPAGHAAALRGAPASAAAIPASTASARTSARTTTPSAVGGTQRTRPPATLLSQAPPVGEPGDPRRPPGGRHAQAAPDVHGPAQPVRHRLPVEDAAVAGRGLDGMADGVTEVEPDPPGRLAFVGGHDLALCPGPALAPLR